MQPGEFRNENMAGEGAQSSANRGFDLSFFQNYTNERFTFCMHSLGAGEL